MNKISRILLVAVIITFLFAGAADASGSSVHVVYEDDHEPVHEGETVKFDHDSNGGSHEHECTIGSYGECTKPPEDNTWDVHEGDEGHVKEGEHKGESCQAVTASISLKKSTSSTYNAEGDKITYTYEINNTGDVELKGPFNITDDKIGTFTCLNSDITLQPGEKKTCNEDYFVTPVDISACSITNNANATVKYIKDHHENLIKSNSDSVTVSKQSCPRPIPEFPSIALPIAAILGIMFVMRRKIQ